MRTRILTAIAILVPVLTILYCNLLWPTGLLAAFLLWAGRRELYRMFGLKAPWPLISGALLAAGLYALTLRSWENRFDWVVGSGVAASLIGTYACKRMMDGIRSWTIPLADLWIAGPVLSLAAIQRLGEHANPAIWRWDNWIFLATVPIWVGDTLGIIVGKTFGKRLLWPALSPKKTWEGSIGNLLGALATSIWLAAAFGIPLWVGVMCGLSAGLLGQAGDLFESTMKRVAGVKDSGTMLPGHGGMLDRIDSILGNSSFVALMLLINRG